MAAPIITYGRIPADQFQGIGDRFANANKPMNDMFAALNAADRLREPAARAAQELARAKREKEQDASLDITHAEQDDAAAKKELSDAQQKADKAVDAARAACPAYFAAPKAPAQKWAWLKSFEDVMTRNPGWLKVLNIAVKVTFVLAVVALTLSLGAHFSPLLPGFVAPTAALTKGILAKVGLNPLVAAGASVAAIALAFFVCHAANA